MNTPPLRVMGSYPSWTDIVNATMQYQVDHGQRSSDIQLTRRQADWLQKGSFIDGPSVSYDPTTHPSVIGMDITVVDEDWNPTDEKEPVSHDAARNLATEAAMEASLSRFAKEDE